MKPGTASAVFNTDKSARHLRNAMLLGLWLVLVAPVYADCNEVLRQLVRTTDAIAAQTGDDVDPGAPHSATREQWKSKMHARIAELHALFKTARGACRDNPVALDAVDQGERDLRPLEAQLHQTEDSERP
jgi:hypothetical protein